MRADMLGPAFSAYRAEAAGALAARLRFMEGLAAVQAGVLSEDLPYALSDIATAREALATGQPVFLSAPPTLPKDRFVAAVDRIAEYVAAEAGLDPAQALALREADFPGVLTEERLARIVPSVDVFVAQVSAAIGAGDDADLKPATVAFVIASALVPFFESAAKAAVTSLGRLDRQSWTLGTCPMCGSPATIGVMGESTELKGGERTLWCALCHTEWAYDRVRCARCGTRAGDKLRYLHVDDDPAHRLHLCDECHGYAKVVFVNDLDKPLSMVVEDAVTLELDALAASQGYRSQGAAPAEEGDT